MALPLRRGTLHLEENVPTVKLSVMKLHLENLPASLQNERGVLERCLLAMDQALPIQQVLLFGSHARGDSRQDSDVDLCLVSESASEQLKASRVFRNAIWEMQDCPAFTLLPITPQRLQEKRKSGDPFFKTVFHDGVLLADED